MSFWLEFALEEGLDLLEAFLTAEGKLTPQQQTDGAALAAAIQKFIGDF